MRYKDILNEQRFQFTVDGYGYTEEEDFPTEEGEPSKKWHYMTTPGGERITLDHSPYQWMDKDEFAVHVAKHKALSEDIKEDLRGDPAMGRIEAEDVSDEVKEAFLAGFSAGYTEGYNEGCQRPGSGWREEETPEEAYEHWVKYDRR